MTEWYSFSARSPFGNPLITNRHTCPMEIASRECISCEGAQKDCFGSAHQFQQGSKDCHITLSLGRTEGSKEEMLKLQAAKVNSLLQDKSFACSFTVGWLYWFMSSSSLIFSFSHSQRRCLALMSF